MKLKVLLGDANNNLSDFISSIDWATKRAEEYVGKRLRIDYGVNIVFAEVNHFLIPEDGVGGRTYRADFILITLDLKKPPSEDKLFEIICHELCHAARWGVNPEYTVTLFDGLISEGIATIFEETAVIGSDNRQVFLSTVLGRSDDENKKILEALRFQLDNSNYHYNEIFFDGNAELPRWAGYSAGYYLVNKYLSATGKTIDQTFADKYADFKIVLN